MSSHGGAKRRPSGIPRPVSRLSQGPRPASALGQRAASPLGTAQSRVTPALSRFMDVGYQAALSVRTFSAKDTSAWKATPALSGIGVTAGVHSFSLDAAHLGSEGKDSKVSLWDEVLIGALKRAIDAKTNLLVHLTGPDKAGQSELADDFVLRSKNAFQGRSDLRSCLLRVVDIEGKASSRGTMVTEIATCRLPEGKRGECKALAHATPRHLDDWAKISKSADDEPKGALQRVAHMEIHLAAIGHTPVGIFLIYNVDSKTTSALGDANARWAKTRTCSADESLVNPLRQADSLIVPGDGAHVDDAPGKILRKIVGPYCAVTTDVINVICLGRSPEQVPHTASCLRDIQRAREVALLGPQSSGAVSSHAHVKPADAPAVTPRFADLEKENTDLKDRVDNLESRISGDDQRIHSLEEQMNIMKAQLEVLSTVEKAKAGSDQVKTLENMQGQLDSLTEEMAAQTDQGQQTMSMVKQCQAFIDQFQTAEQGQSSENDHSLVDLSIASVDVTRESDDISTSNPALLGGLPGSRMVRFWPTDSSTPVRVAPFRSSGQDTPYPHQISSTHSQTPESHDSSVSSSASAEFPAPLPESANAVPRIPTPPTLPKPGWERRLREQQRAQKQQGTAKGI